jgi:hypothetical protein
MPQLVSGAVVTESVFARLSSASLTEALARDYPS